ncbi:MAG: hypothetical protein IPJ77_09630 [Planctomycetes bacterium]|nr:hypothetical protein [Planctomycetota bacterium]
MHHDSNDPQPSISDLEADLEDAFNALQDFERRGELPDALRPLLTLTPPEGASLHVSLRHRDTMRQIRRTLDERSFEPRTCGAWIVFELAPAGVVDDARGANNGLDEYMREFVVALDRAERDPHMSFVALKYFRDQYLARTGHGWARDFDLVRHLIQKVTDDQILVLSRVPNPRQPEFPVTSIRLNREHAFVREVLGADAPAPESKPEAETPSA